MAVPPPGGPPPVIVLRVRVNGQSRDHRIEGLRASLGSGPRADVRYPTAGWPVLAGTVVQDGTEVRLIVPGRVGTLSLRVGDEVRIGRAEVAVVGLLPPETAPAPATARGAAAPSAALFGDYAETTGALPRADAPGSVAAADASTGTAPAGDPFHRRSDFGDELFERLKGAPWYACSIALHVLLFVLFKLLLTWNAPPGFQGGSGRLVMGVAPEQQEADRGPEPEPEQAVEPIPLPELEPVLPAERESDGEPEPATDAPLPSTLVLPPDEQEDPPLLGTLPTLSDASRTTAKRRPKPAPAPTLNPAEAIAKESVRDATRRAAEHVREQLGMDRGGPGDALRVLTERDVLVVEGEWDHHEHVLEAARIPHHMVSPHDASIANGMAFQGARFVFWNCGDRLSPRHSARIGPRVRAWVEAGGYLFTSDWALSNVLMSAFPGYLETRGTSAPLPEMVLEIAPTQAGRAHPLLEGVFTPGVTGRWWLEQASYDVVVKRPNDVTVLVESPQLRDVLQRSPVMAATFPFGRGRVLHLLGHYYQEQGNLAGAIAAQRIALNFVLMGLNASK